MSYRLHIWGWLSCEIARASRSKRFFRSGEELREEFRTLMATHFYRAAYLAPDTPHPWAPSSELISYGPILEPAERPMAVWYRESANFNPK